MSIFGRIKDAIFGRSAQAQEAPAPVDAPVVDAAPATQAAISDVDVDGVLTALAAESGQPLNYRNSIVDLMKLLGMDSTLSERKELAQELGYTGELNGSADMNIWLHKAVLRKLAENGGRVPADLLD